MTKTNFNLAGNRLSDLDASLSNVHTHLLNSTDIDLAGIIPPEDWTELCSKMLAAHHHLAELQAHCHTLADGYYATHDVTHDDPDHS